MLQPENQFAFSGEAKNKRYATEIIHECNEAWKKLIAGQGNHKEHGIAIENTKLSGTPGNGNVQVPADSRKPPAPIDPSMHKWFYIVRCFTCGSPPGTNEVL